MIFTIIIWILQKSYLILLFTSKKYEEENKKKKIEPKGHSYVRSMMKKIMDDELALQLNWCGRGYRAKKAFKDTKIVSIVNGKINLIVFKKL